MPAMPDDVPTIPNPPSIDLGAEAQGSGGGISESVQFQPTLSTPDVSKLQGAALAVGGVPIIANLTAAFGVWAPNAMQQDALQKTIEYGWRVALVLGLSDAVVRAARAHSKKVG